MRIVAATAFLLGACGSTQTTWHDRYVEDNCKRCPCCCSSLEEPKTEEDTFKKCVRANTGLASKEDVTSNCLAYVDEIDVCFEENYGEVCNGKVSEADLKQRCAPRGLVLFSKGQ